MIALLTSLLLLGASPSIAAAACLNEQHRTGASAGLPDCRAYELVTPPDASGRLFTDLRGESARNRFPTELLSAEGNRMVYGTYGSPLLGIPDVGGTFDLYLSERSESGWSPVRRFSPSAQEAVVPIAGGVSRDDRYAFTIVQPLLGLFGGSLTEGGFGDYLSKPDGTFEVTGVGSEGSERFAQGQYISPSGEHIIFSTGTSPLGSAICSLTPACPVKRLEPNAPPTGTGAIYDRAPMGPTHVVSLLPNGEPPAAGEDSLYQGASANGETIAFKVGGTMYVRIENQKTEKVTEESSEFAGLSVDGRYLFYVAGGNIVRFDTTSELSFPLTVSGDAKVAYISDDGSHVYFISESQLAGPSGTAGQPNLYVWSNGATRFIATVSPQDLTEVPGLGNWVEWVVNPDRITARGPGATAARATPDGEVFAFRSRAEIGGYPNNGHAEIYRYDDRTHALQCVSCNPGVPASADARFQDIQTAGPPVIIHNLSDNGNRMFFETDEALVSQDTDELNDIYEWEQPANTPPGIVALISSGQSSAYPSLAPGAGYQPQPNRLMGASPSGDDVVFSSLDQLLPAAGTGGVPALYDARVGGGFDAPAAPQPCAESNCRASASPPAPAFTERTSDRVRKGNVKPHRHRCRHRRKAGSSHSRRHERCHGRHRHRSHSRHRTTRARASAVAAGSEQSASSEPGGQSPVSSVRSASDGSADAFAASDPFASFGIKSVAAVLSTPVAGAHPDFTTELNLNYETVGGKPKANARLQDLSVELPPGLVGNPNSIPRCSTGSLISVGNCPVASQVGVATVLLEGFGVTTEPVYNLELPHPDREVARLGLYAFIYPTFIDIHVRTADDYGVTATVHGASGLAPLLSVKTTLWGNPADPIHDAQRLTAAEAVDCPGTACKAPEGKRSSGIEEPKAFLTNSSACQEQSVKFSVSSYQLPGETFTGTAPLAGTTDCEGMPFEPTLEVKPTSGRAGAPTGLNAVVRVPQHERSDERSTAFMREARVTLPEGMTISASAAQGLEACSAEQVGFHREVTAACPDASKLGTATIVSPALEGALQGAIYQRTPSPGHQFGLWLVTDEHGLHVKLPGEVTGDPSTGQLTARFSDLPQLPVEEVAFDLWGGPRAPLKNPDTCGIHQASFDFKPWSDGPDAKGQASVTIDEGCGAGFSPKITGGVTRPRAGAYSPFVFTLTRQDGEDNVKDLDVQLPQGELARLKGVPLCPEARVSTGACPAASGIGYANIAAGAGPQPLWIPQPGKPQPFVYLAGPFKGAPYSIVSVVAAQAGPFDLGTVVVRSGLFVDPETGVATVKTQLPQVLEGATVLYRAIHIVIDRPRFTINPTDCRPMKVEADVTATHGAFATPTDRFQVGGCKRLKFAPKLSLSLRGGSKRGQYPALTAVMKARKGDANIDHVSVALPHSEFLAQEHIGTICTRKRFAVHKCPKNSMYGYAKAWTPLLSKPLEGPVYLRSSNHLLPDLVAALDGQIEIDLDGRIDSTKGGGIRTTFETVPDAPVTKFVLRMKGGAKSLLVNSTDICRGRHRAEVKIGAQNGRRVHARPRLAGSCKGH